MSAFQVDHAGGVEKACERCGENTYDAHLCRDCNHEHRFALMTCSGCKKLRTVTEGKCAEFADALYGADHRCTCDPRPLTVETKYVGGSMQSEDE